MMVKNKKANMADTPPPSGGKGRASEDHGGCYPWQRRGPTRKCKGTPRCGGALTPVRAPPVSTFVVMAPMVSATVGLAPVISTPVVIAPVMRAGVVDLTGVGRDYDAKLLLYRP